MIRIWSQLKVGPTVQWRLWSCEGPRLDLKYWRTFLPRKEKHQQLRCFPLNTKLSNIVWNVWLSLTGVRSVVCVSARVFLVFRAASSGWKWVYICPHKSVCLVEEVIDQIRRPVLGSLPWPVSSKGLAGSGTWVIFTWPDHQTPKIQQSASLLAILQTSSWLTLVTLGSLTVDQDSIKGWGAELAELDEGRSQMTMINVLSVSPLPHWLVIIILTINNWAENSND